jgi:hypothetical protein
MTVTLTYDNTNAKVTVTADGTAEADRVTIERSINQVVWTTVRGATALPVAPAGLSLPGIAGNYASTPDNAALDVLGDIDLRADVTLVNWRPASEQSLVTKWTNVGPQLSYLFDVAPSGLLVFGWSATGAAGLFASSTVAPTIPASGRLAVRVTLDVDNGAAGRTITFYTGPTISGPWTPLGSQVVQAGVTSIFNSTAPAEIGSHTGGTSNLLAGTVHAVEVRNLIDGTVVANPVFWTQATGATSFADAAGRTWTVNTSGGGAVARITHRQVTLDDYEFTPGVLNYYRVRGVETAPIIFVGAGAAVTANNASVTPPIPVISGGTPAVGDLMLILASIRNAGAGSPNTPTGWSVVAVTGDNTSIFGRRYQAGDTAPTVTFAGGVLNADTIAQMVVFRSSDIVPASVATAFNGSAQNLFFSPLTITQDGCLVIAAGWKQDDWTSVATIAGMTEIGEPFATAGDDAGQVWDYVIQTARANIAGASFVVTGGAAAISRALTLALPHAAFLNEQTATITPVLDRIWLKSLVRPFLNRAVLVTAFTDPGRPARSSEFDVVSRTLPVGVNDVRGSRRWGIELYVNNAADAQTLDFILSAGDTMLLQVPLGCDVPGGYVAIKDTGQRHPDGRVRGKSRVFSLPLVEVAAPGPDVAGTISTWASVLAAYADWNAVLAAFPTWTDLLALHGAPSEVIVP